MWFIVILTLLSAALPQYDFINVYRIPLGWAQIGVFEVGLATGLVLALIQGGNYAARFPSRRTHPILTWLLVLFAIGTLAGLLGSITSALPAKYKIAAAREFVAAPICIIIGYRLLGAPKAMVTYIYTTVLAGIITSILVFYYFNSASEKVEVTGSVHWLRDSIKQVSGEFASCAGLFLLWSLSSGRRIFKPIITFLLMIFCFVGYLATLGRTNAVVMLGGAIAVFLIIPKGRRLVPAIRLCILGPVIFFSLWGAIELGGKIVGRPDFGEKIRTHFATLLPSERHIGEHKAWDSRMGSIFQELELWAENPLFGNGFMSQESKVITGEIENTGAYNHNGWTSAAAKTGIFGFAAVFLMIMTMMVLGYKLVRDNVSPPFVLFGALAFVTGVNYFLRVSCTMAFVSRFAIQYAVVCGMVIRAREMEETTREMQATAAESYGPLVDPQTGLLVPDYPMSGFGGLGGFGSVN